MDIWKHGTYVDLWSLVHFLSGCALIGLLSIFGYGIVNSLLYSLLLLIAWEMFEWLIGIIEPSMNVMVDILIGFLGCLLAVYVYYVVGVSITPSLYYSCGLTLFLAIWGFIDFNKRGYR